MEVPPTPGGSKTTPNTRFVGPTGLHAPNDIAIGSCVLAQCMRMSDRHTQRQTHTHTQTTELQ